ncbi:ecto-ADP-ribosyltransferase 5-like [Rana temporaria]|uniref:ecto-ADP-ribosyltransferase 5-like n=1 Tax=Rana temporaria TaxID=8407 RepID=UPI001AACDA58|nr:ecto-ADP-ribosyltransferase 5-like [Rana temporaria]
MVFIQKVKRSIKMLLDLGKTLCVLHLFLSIQMSHQAAVLDMMPDTFDDQYIGCAESMELEMPKILEEELKYNEFAVMWKNAKEIWKKKRSVLLNQYDDKYGIAVVLYTMSKPYPINKQLNGNVSIAGKSRDFYMKNFHFKALHFYLTRALQVLRTGCAGETQVYRGTKIGAVDVAKKMRFDRFASSSKNMTIAERFGKNPFFNISTCYGVDIEDLSVFKQKEILIPIGETFNLANQINATYELESTGKLCSYFNCAYLGGEKRDSPVCNAGSAGFLYSGPRTHFVITGLIVILNLKFGIFF